MLLRIKLEKEFDDLRLIAFSFSKQVRKETVVSLSWRTCEIKQQFYFSPLKKDFFDIPFLLPSVVKVSLGFFPADALTTVFLLFLPLFQLQLILRSRTTNQRGGIS